MAAGLLATALCLPRPAVNEPAADHPAADQPAASTARRAMAKTVQAKETSEPVPDRWLRVASFTETIPVEKLEEADALI